MIEWALVWAAAPVFGGVIMICGSLLMFIRKNDLSSISDKLASLEEHMTTQDSEIRLKLYEAEFRRHEERMEAQILAVKDSNTDSINKLEVKLDKIIEMLMKGK